MPLELVQPLPSRLQHPCLMAFCLPQLNNMELESMLGCGEVYIGHVAVSCLQYQLELECLP